MRISKINLVVVGVLSVTVFASAKTVNSTLHEKFAPYFESYQASVESLDRIKQRCTDMTKNGEQLPSHELKQLEETLQVIYIANSETKLLSTQVFSGIKSTEMEEDVLQLKRRLSKAVDTIYKRLYEIAKISGLEPFNPSSLERVEMDVMKNFRKSTAINNSK